MNPFFLLIVGLGIVFGSILWLRLHAFPSLMLGALFVGMLTSDLQIQQSMKAKYLSEFKRIAVQREMEQGKVGTGNQEHPADAIEIRRMARRTIAAREAEFESSALKKAVEYVNANTLLQRITSALGETCAKIGLLVAMACIIGRCMLSSGAAERIVRSSLVLFGERGAPLAISASTFVMSIPVFFDSVFLLTIPLAKATCLKIGKNYLLITLALIAGGTITHSLVPPTPGPLFVAKELGVGIGMMIIVGTVIGAFCSAFGLAFAYWINRRMVIPIRESPEAIEQLQLLATRDASQLPPLWLSLLPILFPVFAIGGWTVVESAFYGTRNLPRFVGWFGDANFAICAAAALSIFIAWWFASESHGHVEQIQQAMQEAGVILLICCGGGAFGAMLQQSGIGPYIASLTTSSSLDYSLLPIAFAITALIRTAQGSSTVAMLTAVEIVRSLTIDVDALSFNSVYLAIAIGCGSKPIPWMNDSGFWVMCKMSGMTVKEMLSTQSPMVSLMGVVGIFVTILAAWLIPLI